MPVAVVFLFFLPNQTLGGFLGRTQKGLAASAGFSLEKDGVIWTSRKGGGCLYTFISASWEVELPFVSQG